MINVAPTLPDCVCARVLRFELDRDGLERIAKDAGKDPDDHSSDWIAEWFLKTVEEKLVALGEPNINRVDFSEVGKDK